MGAGEKHRVSRWHTWRKPVGVAIVVGLLVFLALPVPSFDVSYSTLVLDRDGRLLSARIASDEQWRFPAPDSVPHKFKTSLLHFEDRWFYSHPGVRLESLLRATWQNIRAGKIVSGGSTITMQCVRLARGNPSRTFGEKILELFLALRLEWSKEKEEILIDYATHAPFGGNVVGLEAASWRYYGKKPVQLSWAEAATLAVLPNAPGLIYPGRNQETLRNKRDRLLDVLHEVEVLDSLEWKLALLEPLPQRPHSIPQQALHLLARSEAEGQAETHVHTTLSQQLQQQVASVLQNHHRSLSGNHINNLAAVVVDVSTGEVLAYQGNVWGTDPAHGAHNDLIVAPRSSGSILKPILHALALEDGIVTPRGLLPDVPTEFDGFVPRNYHLTHEGAIPASHALARSLNVPAVHLLHRYGVPRFHQQLQQLGLTTLHRTPGQYGLTLILGGAEVTLWDLAGLYRNMAYRLREPTSGEMPYTLHYRQSDTTTRAKAFLSPGALWCTTEALLEVARPEYLQRWRYFTSGQQIAWKTGTSFGFRDAWAVGFTPQYVVAVWAGNADGEGRPGLTGIDAAAPVLFSIFRGLPQASWFEVPSFDLRSVSVCAHSGYRASPACGKIEKALVPAEGLASPSCGYCEIAHLTEDGQYQFNRGCRSELPIVQESRFVLPPVQEWYYSQVHPEYAPLPPWHPSCPSEENQSVMRIVYPRALSSIYVPVDFDQSKSTVVFEATHRQPGTRIHWHWDDQLLATTRHFHQVRFTPETGVHQLTLVDEHGNEYGRQVRVVSQP